MPLYEIEHATPLTPAQKDDLARSITRIHAHLFTTPSLFVNVRFTDTAGRDVYVGGKKKSTNLILAHVRPGGGRSAAQFDLLCAQIAEAWDCVVECSSPAADSSHDSSSADPSASKGGSELRSIFVLGTIVAGREAGFALPGAGEDKTWLKEHLGEFERRAEGGDGDCKDVVEEVRTRGDLRDD